MSTPQPDLTWPADLYAAHAEPHHTAGTGRPSESGTYTVEEIREQSALLQPRYAGGYLQ